MVRVQAQNLQPAKKLRFVFLGLCIALSRLGCSVNNFGKCQKIFDLSLEVLPWVGLSARIPAVEKKITSFRCPVDYLKEVETLCRKNRMDRSTFITMAIRQLVNTMAEEGKVSPMKVVELPPPALCIRREPLIRKKWTCQ